MKRITIAKAKDKHGVLPGFYNINVNGKTIRRVTGKANAQQQVDAARRVYKKRKKLPISMR